MTCTANHPRSVAEIFDAILAGEAELADAPDADVARRLRTHLADLGWEWTRALDAEDRERIERTYPVVD